MRYIAYIYYAYRRTLSYPVLRAYFSTLIVLAFIILFFIRVEIQSGGIQQISIFGHSMSDAVILNQLTESIVSFIYFILLFILTIGTSAIFPDIMKKGAAEIHLTVGYSRTYIVLGQIIGTITCISLMTLIPATIIYGGIIVKTGTFYWSIIGYFLLIIFAYSVLFCWITLISIISNNAGITSIVVIGYVFFLEFYFQRGEILPFVEISDLKRLVLYVHSILPQVSEILNMGTSIMKGTGIVNAKSLIYSIISSFIALTFSILYFRRIDF